MTANEPLSQVQCEEEIGRELNDGKLWGEKFHLTHVETGIHGLRHLLTGSGRVALALGLIMNQVRFALDILSLSFLSHSPLMGISVP